LRRRRVARLRLHHLLLLRRRVVPRLRLLLPVARLRRVLRLRAAQEREQRARTRVRPCVRSKGQAWERARAPAAHTAAAARTAAAGRSQAAEAGRTWRRAQGASRGKMRNLASAATSAPSMMVRETIFVFWPRRPRSAGCIRRLSRSNKAARQACVAWRQRTRCVSTRAATLRSSATSAKARRGVAAPPAAPARTRRPGGSARGACGLGTTLARVTAPWWLQPSRHTRRACPSSPPRVGGPRRRACGWADRCTWPPYEWTLPPRVCCRLRRKGRAS
jgi:hypothetical protein